MWTRGGGSSAGRAPGCGPGGRGFESRPPPWPRSSADRAAAFEAACGGSTPPGAAPLWRDRRCRSRRAGGGVPRSGTCPTVTTSCFGVGPVAGLDPPAAADVLRIELAECAGEDVRLDIPAPHPRSSASPSTPDSGSPTPACSCSGRRPSRRPRMRSTATGCSEPGPIGTTPASIDLPVRGRRRTGRVQDDAVVHACSACGIGDSSRGRLACRCGLRVRRMRGSCACRSAPGGRASFAGFAARRATARSASARD